MRTLFSKSHREWLWPIILATLIFLASGRSDVAAPALQHVDKFTHFAIYGLLTTLIVRIRHERRQAWWALLAVSIYGLTDEWHQSFTPGRSVEVADWLADTLGAALAMILYTYSLHYRSLLERPLWPKRRIVNSGAVTAISTP